jgi:hypothetical protein
MNISTLPFLEAWSPEITVDQILHILGADPYILRKRNARAVAIAEEALATGLRLLTPAVTYRRWMVKSLRHERLVLENDSYLSGPLIAQHLYAAQELAVAVCTIGEAVEKAASETFADDPAYSMALDCFGSLAADMLGAAACHYIESSAELEGKKTTIPLSPGLLGWPVTYGQRELFMLVDADNIGVHLNESCMMIPHKTTSIVVGIGTDVDQQGQMCDYCNMRDVCRHRGYHD